MVQVQIMTPKFFILFCTVAATNAGLLQAPAELAYSSGYNTITAPRAMIKTPVYNSIMYSAPIARTISYLPAQVALDTPAVGTSSQNVVRSFDGTVSQYAKAVDTAYSSVRKYDTRVNNNVYSPAVQTKTIGHAVPAGALLTTYSAPAAKTVTTYSAPVAHVSFNGFGTHYGW